MQFLLICLFSIILTSLSIFSQNVNVKVKTTISYYGKISNENQTVFYDATNYPFIKEVAVKLKKDSVISIPKGNYIIKADFPDFTQAYSSSSTFYPRHFLANHKSIWDATIIRIENDTTLTEVFDPPVYESDSYSLPSRTKISILNKDNEKIESVVVTVYQKEQSNQQGIPYNYHTTAMYHKTYNSYYLITKDFHNSYYAFLFDITGNYLPGYITTDSSVTQNLAHAFKLSGKEALSSYYKSYTIKMEKVVPPNGEFKIRGILDSTILQIIDKNDAQLQSNMPIKWGIVVAYNENNQPAGFAFTDTEGKFEIGKLTAGKYSIKANYLSMQKVVATEIDNSGNTKELNITLDVPNESDDFKLYPNPTNGNCKLYLKLPQASNNLIKITDLNGNEVYNFTTEFTDLIDYSLDLNNYSQGVYNLIIQNENNTFTKKIVKN